VTPQTDIGGFTAHGRRLAADNRLFFNPLHVEAGSSQTFRYRCPGNAAAENQHTPNGFVGFVVMTLKDPCEQ